MNLSDIESLSLKQKTLLLAFLTAFSVSIYIVESAIPKPLPFLRLGLANTIPLLLLITGHPRYALLVGILKSLVGGTLTGTLFSPTTLMSVSGTIVSLIAMLIFSRLGFSAVGLGVAGAVSHNLTQIGVVGLVIMPGTAVAELAPLLILLGIGTGLFTGWLALAMKRGLEKGSRGKDGS